MGKDVSVECDDCNLTHVVSTNLITGFHFAKGWRIRCPYCGGKTKEVNNGGNQGHDNCEDKNP